MARHPGFPVPPRLLPLLYWGDDPGERPTDFVGAAAPAWARASIAFVLGNGVDAHPGIQAKGWANCRICGAQLGTRDLTRFGFVWPEKAEHYLLAHAVWTPECLELLRRVLSYASRSRDDACGG